MNRIKSTFSSKVNCGIVISIMRLDVLTCSSAENLKFCIGSVHSVYV